MAFQPSRVSQNIYSQHKKRILQTLAGFKNGQRFCCSDLFPDWQTYENTTKTGLGKLFNWDVDAKKIPGVFVDQLPTGREATVYIYRRTQTATTQATSRPVNQTQQRPATQQYQTQQYQTQQRSTVQQQYSTVLPQDFFALKDKQTNDAAVQQQQEIAYKRQLQQIEYERQQQQIAYQQQMQQMEYEQKRRAEQELQQQLEQQRLAQVQAQRAQWEANWMQQVEPYIAQLDDKAAFARCTAQADAGDISAINLLSYYYYYRLKDFHRAFYLREKSTDINKANWFYDGTNEEMLIHSMQWPKALFITGINPNGYYPQDPAMFYLILKNSLREIKTYVLNFVRLEKEASFGRAEAQYQLGVEYLRHKLFTDDIFAYQLFDNAFAQGYADAGEKIGRMYYEGWGVAQNDALAFEWYEKAAEMGSIAAAYRAGLCAFNGHGCPKDLVVAKKYFDRVRSSKDEPVKADLNRQFKRSLTGNWSKK